MVFHYGGWGTSGGGGGGGGAVDSVSATNGVQNTGDATDPVLEVLPADSSLSVAPGGVAVNTAVIASRAYVDEQIAAVVNGTLG